METNLYSCTRAGRTNSEKTMEDGNIVTTKDDKNTSASLTNLYGDRPAKLTANGHEFAGEPSSPPDELFEPCRQPADTSTDDKFKKRINPLRIHLGKRPFVDNSLQYYSTSKKRKPSGNKTCDSSTPANSAPRVPKLIPKHIDRSQFHNVSSQAGSDAANERDKPVPRLVPKSQLLQFKKGKAEKGAQLKEYAQSLGLQPMVKFKCRKCCSMSFKTLAMLKEHQLVCRAQAKEPALSPEAAPCPEPNTGGPSRVTRKVYLCSACGTYYENWNLFLHMREVHNRHICLFCLGMFSKAEKLSGHLTNKHNVKEFSYDTKEDFYKIYSGTFYLMCCACDEISTEEDDFFNHDCSKLKPRPVPVLISKNTVKPNNIKNTKTLNAVSSNGPSSIAKELVKPISDRKDSDAKLETVTSQTHKTAAVIPETNVNEPAISDTSISSDSSTTTASKDNTIDSGLESSDTKHVSTPVHQNTFSSPDRTLHMVPNGDESLDHSDGSDSPVSDEMNEPIREASPVKKEEPVVPVEKEKECGIKLKLSLNNANSPVIINSTVDPTIGKQKVHKPPTRVRRPPKRYEKETHLEPAGTPKTPSIRMTICDRADSPFVKTTIFENNKETTLKTLLNNNFETAPKTSEVKPENTVKTTIYDNKLEEINTMNRVPKLTVRVPKELLDKDSSSDYSSDSDVSDKLTVDENNTVQEEEHKAKDEPLIEHPPIEPLTPPADLPAVKVEEPMQTEEDVQIEDEESEDIKQEPKLEPEDMDLEPEPSAEPIVEEPSIPVTELSLDKPLDKYPLKDLLKVFLTSTVHSCIYCNHVRKIAVNCEQLALHMVAQHRFAATVDSITAEELMPETITARLKTGAPELKEGCTDKFVSKKLLNKHLEEHKKKLLLEDLIDVKPCVPTDVLPDASKEPVPVIDLVDIKPKEEAGTSEPKAEPGTEQLTKKEKKKKLKEKDALLLDVNLPALNLSESDSSDESDSGIPPAIKEEKLNKTENIIKQEEAFKGDATLTNHADIEVPSKTEEKPDSLDDKPDEQQVLDIWDNFKKYQAKVEKTKEKTPPLVPIRKHVCESDHDYCLVPTDMNGDDDLFNSSDSKKKSKKSPKKQRGDLSSTSSSSSDSDSSCSCGSNCSCSSSSGSSSSSSSDSDSSDESGNEKEKKVKVKRLKKTLPNRRYSTGSNVDVMGMSETPILIPEKTEPPIAETDLETDESETDEEFYDEHPQRIANKLQEEKRNQLMNLSSVAPSEAGSISGDISRPATPIKEEEKQEPKEEPEPEVKVKSSSSKKKSKKKKKSRNSKKHGPIKINIPKDVIAKSEVEAPPPLIPNKITISLQSNTVQIPEAPKPSPIVKEVSSSASSAEKKRASKRRRVPNKFYGYSSDEEHTPHTPPVALTALKPQQPPKLEWRKEDLPSPVTHKAKKEVPSTVISSRLYNYADPIRLTAPIPDPEPPRILMNSESMESSDSDSSDEGNLEIYQPNSGSSVPPPPTYLNSGTSSLPYAFQRPAVREAREGESVYCYCRCPYDEVSEMIACDAEGCPIEWFHFECVGIMVPPKGKWYCPECRKNQSFSGYR
ncbi:hypothetical protein PYW07_004150 [Mythimna separata]|uniref:PHD-type domain-containing protein n=1 Tax=Mythimna separata TaxID=271217 RepID=A0AAD8DU05_MYTSE|nr:hypothetical protein PYW07_004150 [Mythimna separata]